MLSRAYLADLNQQLLDSLARYHELKTKAASVIPLLLDDAPLPLGLEHKVSLRAVTASEKADAVERMLARGEPGMKPRVRMRAARSDVAGEANRRD